jgi:hypothetical protein
MEISIGGIDQERIGINIPLPGVSAGNSGIGDDQRFLFLVDLRSLRGVVAPEDAVFEGNRVFRSQWDVTPESPTLAGSLVESKGTIRKRRRRVRIITNRATIIGTVRRKSAIRKSMSIRIRRKKNCAAVTTTPVGTIRCKSTIRKR